MDIQRRAFEEAFKQTDYYIAHGDSSTLMLCDDQYALDDVQVAFEIWQAAKAQAVPDGYVVVPKEPTWGMIDAGENACYGDDEQICKIVYQAMISAGENK